MPRSSAAACHTADSSLFSSMTRNLSAQRHPAHLLWPHANVPSYHDVGAAAVKCSRRLDGLGLEPVRIVMLQTQARSLATRFSHGAEQKVLHPLATLG